MKNDDGRMSGKQGFNLRTSRKTMEDIMSQNVLDAILKKSESSRPREYHILVARQPLSADRGDAGFFVQAYGVGQARLVAERLYPPSEYTIVQIKPIR